MTRRPADNDARCCTDEGNRKRSLLRILNIFRANTYDTIHNFAMNGL